MNFYRKKKKANFDKLIAELKSALHMNAVAQKECFADYQSSSMKVEVVTNTCLVWKSNALSGDSNESLCV